MSLQVDETETGGKPGFIRVIACRPEESEERYSNHEDECNDDKDEATLPKGESLIVEMPTKRTTEV